eukprot:PhM_4_TR2111/c1_g1_i9/m.57547
MAEVIALTRSSEVRHAAYTTQNVTRRTVQARTRVMKYAREVGDPVVLLEAWRRAMKASSAVAYAHTLQSQLPELKRNSDWRRLLDRTRQDAGDNEINQAAPANPQQIASLMGPPVSRLVLLMFLSASRHADMSRVVEYNWTPPIVTLRWRTSKSDRYGARRVTKFVEVPRPLWSWMDRKLPLFSYSKVLRYMKKFKLTAHSPRRGAMKSWAEQGFSFKEIRVMSGHTPTEDPELAVRRYVDATPTQPEGLLQRRMSRALAEKVLYHLLVKKNF